MMARRYGILNRYDSQLRRCAISGRNYYESEMVRRSGLWIHPRWLDTDGVPSTKTIGAPDLHDIAPNQDYFEEDVNGDLQPRDVILVGDITHSYFEADSSGGLQPFVSPSYSIWFDLDVGGDIQPRGTGSLNLVTNGDMELDSNWSDYGTPVTNERSSEQVHGGSYSRKLVSNSKGDGIKSDTFATATGQEFTVSFWIYPVTYDHGCRIRVRRGDGVGYVYSSWNTIPTPGQWNEVTFTYTETGGGSGAYIAFLDPQTSSPGYTWYFDDVSILWCG